jgi:hypothetical protein
MTLLAWDGRYVAADSQITCGTIRTSGTVEKISKIGSTVYAFTGTAALREPMIEWVEKGADPDERPLFGDGDKGCTLVVWRDGKCFQYNLDTPYPFECKAPDAWGVGMSYALAAMDCGKTAVEAVEKAIQREVYLGGPVLWVDLKPEQDRIVRLAKVLNSVGEPAL